jgi:hypothetical protein
MRVLIGCAGVVDLVVFVIVFVGFLFARGITWGERVALAAMSAAMVAVPVLLLGSRDIIRNYSTMQAVRSKLLSRNDVSNEDFLASRPCADAALLLETRDAISKFFDVPPVKVDRDLHLVRDLCVVRLDPAFQFCVVQAVIASQGVAPKPFTLSVAGLESIDDLSTAIQGVIHGFGPQDTADDQPNV